MTRRLLTAAVATAAVLLTAGPALAVDDESTAAPSTTAAPTSGIPDPVTLLDILEALYGDGAFDGCCGTQPTPQPSPGYVPPPNVLTPPPSASPRFTPVPPRTFPPGAVVPGGGTGAGVPSTAAPAPEVPTSTTETTVAVPTPAASTCVPNAVRGSAGYSVIDDPDGDGVSCTPPRPAGYADPPSVGPQGIPLSVLLAAVAAALALGAALVYRPRLRGRHRPARKG